MSDGAKTATRVREVVVRNEHGIHARPAALFVKMAARFSAEVTVEKDGIEINGKSIMGLMTLQASYGSKLQLRAQGVDAEQALAALAQLFEQKFEEG
ncbi:MAG: HPr family phosphocarrier protein [Verrucomicrobia bacterium]|nr:HPr family phosphocarrier protein [Verrucomicrobiota bacterium]